MIASTELRRSVGINSTGALVLATACFAAQIAAALLVIPPWQNPDEPQHVMAARLILAHGPNFAFDRDRDEAGERALVASMARHGWWLHYGEQTPDPVPTTFADGPARIVKDSFVAPSGSRVYYRGAAAVFRLLRLESVTSQMQAMRTLSFIASLITVALVWAATRLWLGTSSADVVAFLLVLQPQFVLVSATASPDAAATLAGAVVWWASVRLLAGGAAFGPLAVLWGAAVLGFLIRRMAAPLVLGAAFVTAIVFVRQFRAGPVAPGARRFAWVLVAIAAAAVAAWLAAPRDLDVRTMAWRSSTLVDVLSGIQATRFDPELAVRTTGERIAVIPDFLAGLFRSFWLSAGWVRYRAASVWYGALALLSLGCAIGLSVARKRQRTAPLIVALCLVLLQLSVVVFYYVGIMRAGPQGRYLFPILPAAVSLMWVGWSGLFPQRQQATAAVALVVPLVAFNVAAWTLVLLPAYA